MQTLELTDEEAELIMTIRNYKKSRHNPSATLYKIAHELFDELLEG